jgi:cell division protein FtsW
MAKRSILVLALSVIALLVIGFVMLASASYYTPEGAGADDVAMVWKQAAWFAVAVLASGFCCLMNYERFIEWRWRLFGIAIVTLALCYVPGIGLKINGAKRWISAELIGHKEFRVQPSEFAKMALIIALAAWYSKHELLTRTFRKGFLIPVLMVLAIAVLIGGEMDLGSAIISTTLGMAMMIVAGAKWRYMPLIGITAGAALCVMVWVTPNRMYRVMGFASEIPVLCDYVKLDTLPKEVQKEIEEKKMQQRHGRYALGSGGIEGTGPGQGRMKMYGLPESHTDFIFALVGEELGLRGTLIAVGAFVMIVLSGMCISVYAPNRFGKLLGFGITMLFGLEGLMNMGVTTDVLPNKGLPLPFVSYGGSSLLMAMISIGILCNIYRQGVHISLADLPVIRRKNRWTPQV